MDGPLKLVANPTFRGNVEIPTPEGVAKIAFEFRWMRKSVLKKFIDDQEGKTEAQTVMACASNWYDVDGEFSEENVKLLCDTYHSAGRMIFLGYLAQLTKAKEGN